MTVLIVHADPVVGHALALLLEGTAYQVESVARSSLEELAEKSLLPGKKAELFVLAFDLNAGHCENILRWLKSRPDTADVPTMVLGTPSWNPKLDTDYFVPWPIRTEQLKHQIQAVLANPGNPVPNSNPFPE